MNEIRRFTILWEMIFIFGLYTVLTIINTFFQVEKVPHVQVLAVVVLYAAYYIVHTWAFMLLWRGKRRRSFLALLILSVVLFTLFPVADMVIHQWLPRMDIVLFREDVDYDVVRFQRRVISGYAFVNLLAAITVGISMRQVAKIESLKLKQELLAMQQYISSQRVKNHFIKNILNSEFGTMLMQEVPEKRKELLQRIELLSYFSEIDTEEKGTVDAKDEIRQAKHFIRLFNAHFGEQLIVDEIYWVFGSYQIPRGLLLLPLENYLKHGMLFSGYKVKYIVRETPRILLITCINCINPIERDRKNKDDGTGIKLMEQRIKELGLPIILEIVEEAAVFQYTVYIQRQKGERG